MASPQHEPSDRIQELKDFQREVRSMRRWVLTSCWLGFAALFVEIALRL